MPLKILDRLISAFVGALSAVGTVWFLNANAPDASTPPASDGAPVKFERLEVDALRVNGLLSVVDPQTKETTIELKDGSVFAKNNVFTESVGAFRVLGRKLQVTPNDPLDAQSPVFAELATNQDGGAYLALLSPQETHSITVGFDKTEKGCLVSQNTEDTSMVAQAIFPKPTADQAAPNAAPLEQPLDVPAQPAEPIAPPVDALPPVDAVETPATQEAAPLPAPVDAVETPATQETAPLPTPVDAVEVPATPEAAPLPAPVDAPLPDAFPNVPSV